MLENAPENAPETALENAQGAPGRMLASIRMLRKKSRRTPGRAFGRILGGSLGEGSGEGSGERAAKTMRGRMFRRMPKTALEPLQTNSETGDIKNSHDSHTLRGLF